MSLKIEDPVERRAAIGVWCSFCGRHVSPGEKFTHDKAKGAVGQPGAVVQCRVCTTVVSVVKATGQFPEVDSPAEPEPEPDGTLLTRENTEW